MLTAQFVQACPVAIHNCNREIARHAHGCGRLKFTGTVALTTPAMNLVSRRVPDRHGTIECVKGDDMTIWRHRHADDEPELAVGHVVTDGEFVYQVKGKHYRPNP